MNTNPIKTAMDVCSKLIQRKVYAIIVSKPKQGELSPASVSYTAGFYHIPVIGISSRDSAFSDKNIHVSFLRTLPPYSHQADVWVEMLKQFKYRQLVFIHSSDTDGRALLGRFQTKTQDLQTDDQEVKVEKVEEFEPGKSSYHDTLLKIKECQARVYFLYASEADADQIFKDAKLLNMTGSGYVWIVTEQALRSEYVPEGTLGLKLVKAEDERGHISDSLKILAQALLELHGKENVTQAPSNCNTSGTVWETGKRLFEYIRRQILGDGSTGRVAFDAMGDRMFAEYEIINIQCHESRSGGGYSRGCRGYGDFTKMNVGSYQYSKVDEKMRLEMEQDRIIWPGGLRSKPTGLMIPTHLNVLTIIETPFVDGRRVERASDCNEDEILCPVYEGKKKGETWCCKGYCIDLLQNLSEHCNFTFSLHLSRAEYGALERNNNTGKQEWTGLIGELVKEKADLIVAPLTINPERAQVMEFSKPFKYQGITILQKRQPRASQLVSFLQPFKSTLWVLVLVSVHVVALCLYLLDRFSPFGRFHTEDATYPDSSVALAQREESLNLTSAIWFAWGVLLNAGIGEGTPRSFSARVLGMVWAGFAMIIVASYTANLAAFLVLDKPQTSLTGINDPRLRNPMENFTYATVKGSSVDMYFRRQVELSNMYRTMEGKHYENPEEAIEAVKSEKLKAFIWDSSRLEYEAARDCALITAGDLFGRSGYGVGLQKGSPWSDKVTLAILDFHESGKMEDLDNKWILHSGGADCSDSDDNSPATLGLDNMRGVFILVGAGIVGGLALIIIEIIYKKHQMRRQKRSTVARTAISKWRGTLEKRRTLKISKETKRKIKANGMRNSMGAATPESVTLSVDSLPNRQLYPSKMSITGGGGGGGGVGGQTGASTWQMSPIVNYSGGDVASGIFNSKENRSSIGLFNNSMDSCGGGANSDTDLDLDLKTEVSALATGRNEGGHHGHISRQPAKSRPSGQIHQRPRSASSSVVDHVLVADMAGSRDHLSSVAASITVDAAGKMAAAAALESSLMSVPSASQPQLTTSSAMSPPPPSTSSKQGDLIQTSSNFQTTNADAALIAAATSPRKRNAAVVVVHPSQRQQVYPHQDNCPTYQESCGLVGEDDDTPPPVPPHANLPIHLHHHHPSRGVQGSKGSQIVKSPPSTASAASAVALRSHNNPHHSSPDVGVVQHRRSSDFSSPEMSSDPRHQAPPPASSKHHQQQHRIPARAPPPPKHFYWQQQHSSPDSKHRHQGASASSTSGRRPHGHQAKDFVRHHQQQHRGYSNPTQLQQQTAGNSQSGIKGNGSGGYPPPHPLSDQWQASNTSKESNATRRRRVNSPYVVEDSDV